MEKIIGSYSQEGQNKVDQGGWSLVDGTYAPGSIVSLGYNSDVGNFAKIFNGGKPFDDDLKRSQLGKAAPSTFDHRPKLVIRIWESTKNNYLIPLHRFARKIGSIPIRHTKESIKVGLFCSPQWPTTESDTFKLINGLVLCSLYGIYFYVVFEIDHNIRQIIFLS